uniref:ATP synthase F0 subunit 8 n=1 Tax=Lema sp. LEM01 TaxID=1205561 RepID=A0A0S2MPG6_9CUCU|nr:ATP synthase F0 subunit 8 [Lema sp. LEM01]
MPQMAPLNWISLMIYFVMLLYMFNMMNYFINLFLPKKSFIKIKNLKLNWKW